MHNHYPHEKCDLDHEAPYSDNNLNLEISTPSQAKH